MLNDVDEITHISDNIMEEQPLLQRAEKYAEKRYRSRKKYFQPKLCHTIKVIKENTLI